MTKEIRSSRRAEGQICLVGKAWILELYLYTSNVERDISSSER
jgi:hypothetical protein